MESCPFHSSFTINLNIFLSGFKKFELNKNKLENNGFDGKIQGF